jgi:hypothetical protein
MRRPTKRLVSWSLPPSSTGLDRDGVLSLQKRVERLQHGQRRVLRDPLLEILAGQDLLDGVALQDVEEGAAQKAAQPLGVEMKLGLGFVQDLERLLLVGLRVLGDLRLGELGPGAVAARGIAHERREVADDEHRRVPEVLEGPELAQDHAVAQMKVRRGRVDAELHPEGAALLELFAQFLLVDEGKRPSFEESQIVTDVTGGRHCAIIPFLLHF